MANKPATKKKGRPSKKAVKKSEINRSWSIVMFAVGVLFFALCMVKGTNIWTGIRTFLFGMFGFTSYIIGPVLIYLAVLTATDKPVKWKMAQSVCFIFLASAFVQIFFSADITETGFFNVVKGLYAQGGDKLLSGGVISGAIATPMLIFFGDLPSKITVTVLAVVFFMFLTDTTPYDIYKRTSDEAVKQKQGLEKSMQENKIQRQEQREKREAERLLQEETRSKPKKIDFDIDEPTQITLDTAIDVAKDETFVETFDEVEKQKKLEQQKIEDIMKKLSATAAQADKTEPIKDEKIALTTDVDKTKAVEETPPVSQEEGHSPPPEYKHPPISLFEKSTAKNQGDVEKELKTNAQ
ncbi:MAG: hypothetical protein RR728_04905, partial [Oscillospiraceae bacterium]